MCFVRDVDDYQWMADVVEVKEGIGAGIIGSVRQRCCECNARLLNHHWRRYTYFRENKEPDDNGSYGRSAHYLQCERCVQLIEAIAMVEIYEGCDAKEAVPDISDLYGAVEAGNGWIYYADEYARLCPGEWIDWPIEAEAYQESLIDQFTEPALNTHDTMAGLTHNGNYWCQVNGHDVPPLDWLDYGDAGA